MSRKPWNVEIRSIERRLICKHFLTMTNSFCCCSFLCFDSQGQFAARLAPIYCLPPASAEWWKFYDDGFKLRTNSTCLTNWPKTVNLKKCNVFCPVLHLTLPLSQFQFAGAWLYTTRLLFLCILERIQKCFNVCNTERCWKKYTFINFVHHLSVRWRNIEQNMFLLEQQLRCE